MAFHLNERAYQDFLDGADTYDDYDEQYVQMLCEFSDITQRYCGICLSHQCS